MAQTVRFHRRHLPHWEVEQGRYFVTVRCADSQPKKALLRLGELTKSLQGTAPRSAQFATLQRETFRTLEKYLDAGHGACALRRTDVAKSVVSEFTAMTEWQVSIPHFTVMPNHWHALLVPSPDCPHTLSAIIKRIKGRTAKRIRALLGGNGPV